MREATDRISPASEVAPLAEDSPLAPWPTGPLILTAILTAAEHDAYRAALIRHGGSITGAARALGVDRKTASRAVGRLGLRAWLDATWPHRDPATVGRRGALQPRTHEWKIPLRRAPSKSYGCWAYPSDG